MPAPQPVPRRPVTPQPLGRSGAAAARPTAISVAESTVALSPHSPSIAVIQPRLRPAREKIMIMGDTVSGKSYAYMRLARQKFEEWQELIKEYPDAPMPRFFVLDTDDTMPTFLNEGDEFEDLYHKNGGNVFPYPATSWAESRQAYASITRAMKPNSNDWLVIDVGNRLYTQAQDVVAHQFGIDVTDATIERLKNRQGFGAFNTDQWQMITRAFNSIVEHAIMELPCNVIYVSHITEVQDIRQRPEKRETLLVFDELGFKPANAPRVPGMMNTVVVLWAVRRIIRDEDKVSKPKIGAETIRHVTMVKDRGKDAFGDFIYDRDLFKQLPIIRRTLRERGSTNVTDARRIAEINAAREAERVAAVELVIAAPTPDATPTESEEAPE